MKLLQMKQQRIKLKMSEARKNIDLFKGGTFPYKGDVFKTKKEQLKEKSEVKEELKEESEEELKEESEEELKEESKEERSKKFTECIGKESKDINYDLFKTYFNFSLPSALAKQFHETKNKNNKLVNVVNNGLSDLKDKIEKMSEDEKKIEKPDKLLKIVETILDFNKQQQGPRLKILTPDQMLRRLPTTLAQLNAGNNSEKLKNEIRQLFYSLYRPKKLTKQLYKSLIDII